MMNGHCVWSDTRQGYARFLSDTRTYEDTGYEDGRGSYQDHAQWRVGTGK